MFRVRWHLLALAGVAVWVFAPSVVVSNTARAVMLLGAAVVFVAGQLLMWETRRRRRGQEILVLRPPASVAGSSPVPATSPAGT